MVTTNAATAVTDGPARPDYRIDGVVLDRATQKGIAGVRVDAWDKDTRYHDLLGQVITNDAGAFTIGFTSDYFGDFAPDRSPDLYFNVFLDGRQVLTTFDRPMMNVPRGITQVTLMLDLPQLRPTGTDRVSAAVAIRAVDWWRASDFRATWAEGRDKVATVGKLVGLVATARVARFDLKPVVPQSIREREVVGRDPMQAQRALAAQQIEVSEVRPLDVSGGARDNLLEFKGYPTTLKQGDKVVLYEENGVVRYYTRVAPPTPAGVDNATVVRIDSDVQTLKTQVQGIDLVRADVASLKAAEDRTGQRLDADADLVKARGDQVTRLQSQLAELRQATADKDVQIAKLQSDLALVRTAQDNLAARFPLDRLTAIETQLKRLQPTGTTPAVNPQDVKTVSKAVGTRTAPMKKNVSAKASIPREPGPDKK